MDISVDSITHSAPVRAVMSAHPNVGQIERYGSIVAGTGLAVLGFTRKTWVGLALVAAGAALLTRGVTGKCGVYSMLGIDTSAKSDGDEPYMEDKVDRASWESFPASDAPAKHNIT